MHTLRLVPERDHEPDGPIGGAALPQPRSEVTPIRQRPAAALIERVAA